MREMLTDTQIINRIQEHRLEVWICSPGGSGSNMLSRYLHEFHNLRTREPIWHNHVCHFPTPLPIPIPTIYLFTNLVDIYRSNKFKGHIEYGCQHRKLSRNLVNGGDDITFLDLVSRQFTKWTTHSPTSAVLFLQYEDMFTTSGQRLIEQYLGITMTGFPKRTERKSIGTPLPRRVREFMCEQQELVTKMQNFVSHVKHPVSPLSTLTGITTMESPTIEELGRQIVRLKDEVEKYKAREITLKATLSKIVAFGNIALKK